jgi:hypothetical protein
LKTRGLEAEGQKGIEFKTVKSAFRNGLRLCTRQITSPPRCAESRRSRTLASDPTTNGQSSLWVQGAFIRPIKTIEVINVIAFELRSAISIGGPRDPVVRCSIELSVMSVCVPPGQLPGWADALLSGGLASFR